MSASRNDDAIRIEERVAIERLMYDYGYYLDMNRPDDLAELFVQDCVVVYGPDFKAEGRAEYRRLLDGIGSYFSATSHHVSNVAIDFEGPDRAVARSVLLAWHQYNRERPCSIAYAQYHDVVQKNDAGRWQFVTREVRLAGHENYHVKDNIPIGRA